MVKAVIFDLDGTISDTISALSHFGNTALEFCGLEPIDINEYKYFAGDGKVKLIHRMLAYRNADTAEMFEKAEKKYDFEYENDVLYDTKPFDGIVDMLKSLKEMGIKLAVLSNKPDNVTVMIVERLFGGLFDKVYGKRDGIAAKPDPEGVRLLLDEMGVMTDEAVFVGDTNVDIYTAKNSGLKSIGVLWGFRGEKELLDAGADFIAERTKDIVNIIIKIENEKTRD